MGPLVLQTFGAHWTAVASARKLDGIDDANLPIGKPVRWLGLTIAAISILTCYQSTLIIFLF